MANEKIESTYVEHAAAEPQHSLKGNGIDINQGNEAVLLRVETEVEINSSVKLAKDGHVSFARWERIYNTFLTLVIDGSCASAE